MKTRSKIYKLFLLVSVILLINGLVNYSFSQWQQAGLDGYYIRTITQSGVNLFAGTSGDGLYVSSNNGTSWSQLSSGLIGLEFPAFTVSGANLFAGTEGSGVFISTNSGSSWTALTPLPNQNVFALAVSGANLYAGVDGGGVFRSTNNGSTWTNSTSGMTNTRITSLAVTGNSVFAGTFGGGVFYSTNNGTSWSAVNTGILNLDVWTVNITPSYPGYVFAGTSGGVFYTSNNGNNWISFNSGLTDTYIHTLAFAGQVIFTGTDFDGVFRSTNLGGNWIAMNEGLSNTTVWVLTTAGQYLYAGTNGNGVFKRALTELVSVNNSSEVFPENFSLTQNYPNPFNPVTKIKYSLKEQSIVKLSVYDASGKMIENLKDGMQSKGNFEVEWNAVNYSSGIYYYKLEAGNYSETKKMILVK